MNTTLRIVSLVLVCATAQAASAVDELEGYVLIEDDAGNPLYAADAEGNEVTFVYDESGQVVSTIDQDGVVTDMTQPGAATGGGQ